MGWVEIRVTVGDAGSAELAATLLEPFAADQVVIHEQTGDPADLDPTALLPDVTVKIYRDESAHSASEVAATHRQIAALLARHGLPTPHITQLDDIDWANAWRANYHPLRVGRRLWIEPSWERRTDHDADDIVIALDPGMAFGTGTHATTQLCLELLEAWVRPNDHILDLGTGSGILAIAAARLGAARVLAVDIDPQSVTAARENVAANGVADVVTVDGGSLDALAGGQWHIVVANILATVLIEMIASGGLTALVAPGGRLMLSGILAVQQADVAAALAAVGWELDGVRAMGEWVALVGREVGSDSAE